MVNKEELQEIENILFQDGLDKLETWLKKKNWTVDFLFNKEDILEGFQRNIVINKSFKKEFQLYALLHECGHLLSDSNINNYLKYPTMSNHNQLITKNKSILKSKKYKIDLLECEIEAWNKGLQLAKKLNIYVNRENYYSEKCKYVYTYIESF